MSSARRQRTEGRSARTAARLIANFGGREVAFQAGSSGASSGLLDAPLFAC